MKFDARDLLRKSAPWRGVKKEALTSHEPAMDLQLHHGEKEGIRIRHYDILEWVQEQEKRPAPALPK
jgi:hypothetical protein